MRPTPSRLSTYIFFLPVIALCLFNAPSTRAQSADLGRPTPVLTSEISGRISPRDVGDARLTRHFYAFTGIEGDLFITVESTELNGDVDVFTASTLRPLLKITVISSPLATRATKSVYLRVEEPLILRVEGRAAGDVDAQYRVRFEGAFRPASGALAEAGALETSDNPETASTSREGRRTTATGARIPLPPGETATRPESRSETQPSNAETTTGPASTEAAAETTGANRNRPSRTPTRRGTRRNRPAREPAVNTGTETTDANRTTGEETGTDASVPKETVPATPPRSRPTRRGSRNTTTRAGRGEAAREGATAPSERPATAETSEASPEPSTRLVIVTKDGETIERDMKTVRRVTVERGQIVIVGTDGKISRQPLSNVLRMAIEP